MKVIKRLKSELRTKRENVEHMKEKINFYKDHIPKVEEEARELENIIDLLERHYETK